MKKVFLIKYLSLILLVLFLFLPTFSSALELTYPEIMGIRIELDMDMNRLVAWFYYFIVGISGLAAFLMLVWGGFIWLTSIGSPAKISDAKETINSAVIGLIIILASVLILKVINPDLITLNLPGLP